MPTERDSGNGRGSRRARALLVALALAVGVVGGVMAATRDAESTRAVRTVPTPAASTRWPVETLEDWLTFADQVSTMSVVAERQLPIDERTKRIGEGPVGREVTAVIRSTLWAFDDDRVVRGTIRFRTWGWVLHDGELLPVVPEGEERLEVGDEVVAPLMRTPEGEFAPIAPQTVLQLVDGRIASAEGQAARNLPALRDLHGHGVEELGTLLRRVEVDPRLRRLDPQARAAEIRSRG